MNKKITITLLAFVMLLSFASLLPFASAVGWTATFSTYEERSGLNVPLFYTYPTAGYVNGSYLPYVSAHWNDGRPTVVFLVNGTNIDWLNGTITAQPTTFGSKPEHFHYYMNANESAVQTGVGDKEYWLSSQDVSGQTFYITMLTYGAFLDYTVQFDDLANVLSTYQYVSINATLNGVSHIIQKSKLDVQDRVHFSCLYQSKYAMQIGNGVNYDYGDVLFEDANPISLQVSPLNFPDNILIGAKYAHMWAVRNMENVTFYYENTMADTISVDYYIYFAYNNTLVTHQAGGAVNTWVSLYSGLDNETDYVIDSFAVSTSLGTIQRRQPLLWTPATSDPWDLSFLGTLPFDTSQLIPLLILLIVAGASSAKNVWLGIFLFLAVTALFITLGWISIGINLVAICAIFAVLAFVAWRFKER
jgi:hypothetical protein